MNRKSHNEFIEDVKKANSLPEKTKKALGPGSDEDRAMYANCPKMVIDEEEVKWCSICNKTESELGFELNVTHDGEWICEDCEDAEYQEDSDLN